MLALIAKANPSLPHAPRILPDCAAGGCTTLQSVMELFSNIALVVLGVAGIAMLAVFVYGGLLYLTSRGQPGQVQKATKALTGAVIGLIIVFSAFTVIDYGATALMGTNATITSQGGKYVICGTADSLGGVCAPGKICIEATGGEACVEEGGEAHQQFLREQAAAASATVAEDAPASLEDESPSIIEADITALESLQNE